MFDNFQSALSDEQAETITATWPKCPTCGELPTRVQYTYHALHSLDFSLDGSANLTDEQRTLINDQEYDILDKEPVTDYRVVNGHSVRSGPTVECENGHSWIESRLMFVQTRSSVGEWELLPDAAGVDAKITQLELLLKQRRERN